MVVYDELQKSHGPDGNYVTADVMLADSGRVEPTGCQVRVYQSNVKICRFLHLKLSNEVTARRGLSQYFSPVSGMY
jgi:hypothetical protein